MMPVKLSIIIPAKNEEGRISRTLSTYGTYFKDRKGSPEVEIIVVVNNSNDATSAIVDKYATQYPFIKRLETKYSSGKGGAVALGFNNAQGSYIGFVDADGAVPPWEMLKLYEFLEETPWLDGVTGSRILSKVKLSFKRKMLGKIYNILVKVLFDLPYTDTQCAAKIFRREPAKQIAQKLSNTGWGFDVNLLLVAKYLNYRILERPVVWSEKEGSKFSWFVGTINAPLELLQLKLRDISYHYENNIGRFFRTKSATNKATKSVLIFAWRDIKHPEMGGSEVYVHEIAKRLAKNYQVILFTAKPGNLDQQDSIDGVHIIRKGNFLTVYLWAFIFYVYYFRKNCDIIIDVQNGLPFFTPLYSSKPRIVLIHHLHKQQWFKQFVFPVAAIGYLLETLLFPLIYRKTQAVTVSPSTFKELVDVGFNQKTIYIAYNSISSKAYGRFKRTSYPSLLYLGRVKAYKRVEIALDALKAAKKYHPETRLSIGGTGDHLDAVISYAKKLGVTDSVDFLGFVSESKKWELYRKSWVFLMPSIKEGWGITVIEAAACGTPTVGFNVAGIKDSVVNGQTGLLADNANDFYSKVLQLVAENDVRQSMSSKCAGWANNFSWDKSAAVFEQIINHAFGGNLLSDKVYPWDLELKGTSVSSLTTIK